MQELAEFVSGNLLLVTGFVASGFAVLFYELRIQTRAVGSLSTVVAVRVINEGVAVVDVRTPDLFAAGHITDARNVPEAELLQNPALLEKNRKGTLLVCDSGARSAVVAAKLRKGGTENIFSIKGGLSAWQQDNLPLVRSEVK